MSLLTPCDWACPRAYWSLHWPRSPGTSDRSVHEHSVTFLSRDHSLPSFFCLPFTSVFVSGSPQYSASGPSLLLSLYTHFWEILSYDHNVYPASMLGLHELYFWSKSLTFQSHLSAASPGPSDMAHPIWDSLPFPPDLILRLADASQSTQSLSPVSPAENLSSSCSFPFLSCPGACWVYLWNASPLLSSSASTQGEAFLIWAEEKPPTIVVVLHLASPTASRVLGSG